MINSQWRYSVVGKAGLRRSVPIVPEKWNLHEPYSILADGMGGFHNAKGTLPY